MTLRLALLVAAVLSSGCISLPKGEPPPVRYFDPTLPAPAGEGVLPAAPFRLGRVTAAEHLRERLVWRTGETELGFYDDRRWTELPVRYLERALGDELHRRRAAPTSPPDATLDVRLESFAESVGPRSVARVSLRGIVERRDGVRREVVVRVDRPIEGDDPLLVATGLGSALVEAVGRLVAEAAATLE